MYDFYERNVCTYNGCCLSIQFRYLLFDLVAIESNLFQNLNLFYKTRQIYVRTELPEEKPKDMSTLLETIPEKDQDFKHKIMVKLNRIFSCKHL